MRLLFWLALLVLIGFAVRAKFRKLQKEMKESTQRHPVVHRDGSAEQEKMLLCAHCQAYFPASEAVRESDSGPVYCCDEHRRLGGTPAP